MNEKPITILLAEDDHDDRYLIGEALDESGLDNQLFIVENGEELLDYLRNQLDLLQLIDILFYFQLKKHMGYKLKKIKLKLI